MAGMSDRPPVSAAVLGAAGLLPTLAALAVSAFGPEAAAAMAWRGGAAYGATILAFVGGAWWGLAAARAPADRLGGWLAVSVLPSLHAALVLAVLSPLAVAALGVGFMALIPVDRRLADGGLAPAWWMTLRLPLSLAMGVLHLALAALGPGA
jgi:hypothetical protein